MKSKYIVIISLILIALGTILFSVGIGTGAKQEIYFSSTGVKISDGKQKTESINTEQFSNINIDINFYNIEFIPSDNYKIEYTYYDDNDLIHNVYNNSLEIKEKDRKYFGINLLGKNKTKTLKIYYVKSSALNNVIVKINSGEINLINLETNNLEIENDFGKIVLDNIKANTINIENNSSNIDLSNINSNRLKIENDFGKIKINNLNTEILEVETDSSTLEVNNGNSKNSKIENDFGKIDLNSFNSNGLEIESNSSNINLKGNFAGKTNIKSDFGNVKISTTIGENDYNYDIKSDFGEIKIDNVKQSNSLKINNNSINDIIARINSGNITISFE